MRELILLKLIHVLYTNCVRNLCALYGSVLFCRLLACFGVGRVLGILMFICVMAKSNLCLYKCAGLFWAAALDSYVYRSSSSIRIV